MTTYTEAVAEARQLVKRSEEDQWRLAELTWEQVEAGKSRTEWARDIGTSQQYAGLLYQVWNRYRDSDDLAFSDAYAMVQRGVNDPGEARQKAEDLRAIGVVRSMPSERKAEVARELLAEPEVAEQVVTDDAARTNVRQALDRRYEQAPKLYPPLPEPRQHDHTVEVLVRLRAISTAIKNATDLILTGPQLDGTDDLLAVLDWQANALSIIRTALTGTDMDAELAKILENGS